MNPCDELRTRLLDDLQRSEGLGFPKWDAEKKIMGTHVMQYNDILRQYCLLAVPRKLFLEKYKNLTPIECFQEEEKKEWKKFVNDIFPGTTPQFRLEAVKIIYTIGVLSN